MNNIKFYICKHCGNIIVKIEDSGVPVVCCSEEMMQLVPKTKDTAYEKHLPVVDIDGDTVEVRVGSIPHPMEEEHHIAWIVLVTTSGYQIKYLDVPGEPMATFKTDEEVIGVYEYCNLHGLWYKEI